MTEIRPGTRVAIGDIVGEVATIRVVESEIYVLLLRLDAGGHLALRVRRDAGELMLLDQPPVDVAAAATLARRVLARKEPRMPVAAIADTLAAALLALADGPTPALSVGGRNDAPRP